MVEKRRGLGVKLRILAYLVLFLAVVPVHAEKRYIVRGSSKAVQNVVSKNRLKIRRQARAGAQVFALVTDPDRRSANDLAKAAGKESGLDAIEPDADVLIPEAPQGLQLNQSTVAILDGGAAAPFFGSTVWSSYLTQGATGIVGLPRAWRLATGSGTVAVIDTGVDPRHPVLAGSLAPGYDFLLDQPGYASELAGVDQSTVAILDGAQGVDGKALLRVNQSTVAILDQSTVAILDQSTVGILDRLGPSFGHGTMVAGLIHLVAPTARIMPLRTFHADGTGKLYDVLRAIYYAVDSGAKVINMSFSMKAPSKELEAAIRYANSRRVICIASAGNDGSQTMVYPAGWNKVEGVGSTNDRDRRSEFSNYGNTLVSFAAPGESLITIYPGQNYAAASGTSFSTALVSGAAALLVEIEPRINQAQAEKALSKSAVPVPQLGSGRIDIHRACSYAQQH